MGSVSTSSNRQVWWLTGNDAMEQREMEEIKRLPAYTFEAMQRM
jgi:hypothetical protein